MQIKIPFVEGPGKITPDNAAIASINSVNWPDNFPYKPNVTAKLWHNGKNLFIKYEVDEKDVMALASIDNGEVWKDSCAEFFVAFDNKGYYNIESNCIGKILMSHRKSRKENVEYASEDVLSLIKRNPSLGSNPFECKPSSEEWSLLLEIPVSSFFKHDMPDFHGLHAKANIYKCGDNLPTPHFISWNPIKTENPDFHRPEFFGDMYFE